MIILKSIDGINKLRRSNQLVAETLRLLRLEIKPGITTRYLDTLAETFARDHGARPAFKGYMGFPASICTSVNDEVVHGIPSGRVLKEGDIISIDFGVELDGYYGDSAYTIGVGEVSEDAKKIINIGREALYEGIGEVYEGGRLSTISYKIQKFSESYGYSIVRNFVGHGIGKQLHEDPQVPNFSDYPGRGLQLRTGLVIAIEPMLCEGTCCISRDKNRWTTRTLDGKLSSHWEHTVAIIDGKPEILSKRMDEYDEI